MSESKQRTLFQAWQNVPKQSTAHCEMEFHSKEASIYVLDSDDDDDAFMAAVAATDDNQLLEMMENNNKQSEKHTKEYKVSIPVKGEDKSLYNITDGFDLNSGRLWIYPTNYAIRDYQFNIVQQALFKVSY